MRMFAHGKFHDYGKMVAGRIKFNDNVDKGFEESINNIDKYIRILVNPRS